jgi:DNA-binding GntR family transcriptional regulator
MVNKESGIPYYRQLMDLVQQQIAAGLLKEGQQISTELEMSEAYQLNRHTVRQAIGELCRLRVLYKLRGRGTFVAKAPLDSIEYHLSAKNRFTDNIVKSGRQPENKIVRAIVIAVPKDVKDKLDLNPNDQVYCLDVLRFVDERPFLVARNFLPAKHFPDLLEHLKNFHSLSQLYAQYDIDLNRVKSLIRATFPNQEEAMLLDIPSNMPVLKVENILKSQEDILIAYNVSCYRGDQAKLSIAW